MALIVQCISIPVPPSPPRITIPHFGVLQKAWNALDGIPSAAEMLVQFQDVLAPALAPVRRFLEIVQVFLSIQKCLKAIPDAILAVPPDPAGLYDCFKDLVKALKAILAWIPPMPYIMLGKDIAGYCIDLLDEIIALFVRLHEIIDDYVQAHTLAIQTGDAELLQIIDCGISEVKAQVTVVLDLLQFIQPINDLLMDVFLQLLPGGETLKQLKKSSDQYKQVGSFFTSAAASLRAGSTEFPVLVGGQTEVKLPHQLLPIPPISPLLEGINMTRNALVNVYNLLAPIIGEDANKKARTLPEFIYF